MAKNFNFQFFKETILTKNWMVFEGFFLSDFYGFLAPFLKVVILKLFIRKLTFFVGFLSDIVELCNQSKRRIQGMRSLQLYGLWQFRSNDYGPQLPGHYFDKYNFFPFFPDPHWQKWQTTPTKKPKTQNWDDQARRERDRIVKFRPM